MTSAVITRTGHVRHRELIRPFLVFVVVCPFASALGPGVAAVRG